MRIRLFITCMFLLALAPNAFGVCVPTDIGDRQDAYAYARAMLHNFELAQLASSRIATAANVKPSIEIDEFIAQVTNIVTAEKLAKDDFLCAAQLMEPFKLSKDEITALAADTWRKFYLTFANLTDEAIDAIDAPPQGQTPASALRGGILRGADVAAKFEQMWELQGHINGASMEALIQRPDRLKITQRQRTDLIQRIDESFGEAIVQQTGPALAPDLFKRFLLREEWKSKDAP